jgi:hypothetical protein
VGKSKKQRQSNKSEQGRLHVCVGCIWSFCCGDEPHGMMTSATFHDGVTSLAGAGLKCLAIQST